MHSFAELKVTGVKALIVHIHTHTQMTVIKTFKNLFKKQNKQKGFLKNFIKKEDFQMCQVSLISACVSVIKPISCLSHLGHLPIWLIVIYYWFLCQNPTKVSLTKASIFWVLKIIWCFFMDSWLYPFKCHWFKRCGIKQHLCVNKAICKTFGCSRASY